MLSGLRNAAASGFTTNRNLLSRPAASSSSPYEKLCPAADQHRMHDCKSHSPAMFFNSRMLPHTPPSFVKLRSRARGVITGSDTSAPSRDHVPELRNTLSGDIAIAATAEPVSWHAGAITGTPSSVGATSRLSRPISVPGWTIGGNNRDGKPSSSINGSAQPRVFASTICVVVAIVYSEARPLAGQGRALPTDPRPLESALPDVSQ